MLIGKISALQELRLTPETLLLFVDESGNEQFKQKNFPIFAFGGIAILYRNYEVAVRQPWAALKKTVGCAADRALHAAHYMKDFGPSAIAPANAFFRAPTFGRIGVAVSDSTQVASIVAGSVNALEIDLRKRVADMASWQPFTGLAIVFEDSPRIRADVEKHFGGWRMHEDGKGEIPVQVAFMDKSTCEAGLEVADFVANVSGREARARLTGAKSPQPDFQQVFWGLDPRLASYLYITSIQAH